LYSFWIKIKGFFAFVLCITFLLSHIYFLNVLCIELLLN
jgi:hypothetical protein